MTRDDCAEIVKKEFNFGWKTSGYADAAYLLALEYQKGDILDVGCGTCQFYNFLSQKGWTGGYVGIDLKQYRRLCVPCGR